MKHVFGHHWPHYLKKANVVVKPTLGQQQYSNCLNFSVEPMFAQYLCTNIDVLRTTPTIDKHGQDDKHGEGHGYSNILSTLNFFVNKICTVPINLEMKNSLLNLHES